MTEVTEEKKCRSTLLPPMCYWNFLKTAVCRRLVWGIVTLQSDMSRLPAGSSPRMKTSCPPES